MRKTNLDNKTIDLIGRKLVEGESQRLDNVERIISNPHLFAAVRKRIATNENTQIGRLRLPFYRRSAVAFAGAALILVVAVAVSFIRSENTLFAVKKVQVPDAEPEVARPVFPPQGIDNKLSAGRAFEPAIQPVKSMVKTVSTRVGRKQKNAAYREPANEFYAISTGYDQNETGDGSRIVRVDVPRSSLFALGVNIPLENDAEVVKADLLIGSDGVTRAIRVVK